MRKVAATLLGYLAIGSAMAHSPIGAITNLQIDGYESSPDCSTFHPNKGDVARFFSKAVVVTGQTLHEHYDVYPCSAHGTLVAGHATWSWVLRAGGTALVKSSRGEAFVLGDPNQETSPSDG